MGTGPARLHGDHSAADLPGVGIANRRVGGATWSVGEAERGVGGAKGRAGDHPPRRGVKVNPHWEEIGGSVHLPVRRKL